MRKCFQCGQELENGALFCNSCGAKVEETTSAEKVVHVFCYNCGEKLENDALFCSNCGVVLKAAISKNKC